jgi:hypothetical protein
MATDLTIPALIVLLIAMTASAVGLAMAWLLARERARRAEQRLLDRTLIRDERADRLERALEAMAVDLERVAEGQRFTTKLLAQRPSAEAARPRVPEPPRIITPH